MVLVDFQGRGCGGIVRHFGDRQTLIVSKGSAQHAGWQYLFKWAPKK